MRMLKKNQSDFAYALYQGEEPVYDEYDNQIGTRVIYSSPVFSEANISSAMGTADIMQFGTDISYDKTIATENIPIDENSVLWIDDLDITKPYDYIVKKISKSLNSQLIAVSKVKIS